MGIRKKLLSGLLKAVFLGLFTFVTLEIILFLSNDLIFRGTLYEFDPDAGFRVRPYARYGNERANEFGFNDRDHPHQREPGTYRILVLGDSFNWMGGPDCNYTALLRRKLQAAVGDRRVEVINAGYSQTHTAEQLPILRKFGLRYHPDLVVLGFYAGNDFLDAHPQRKRIAFGGALIDVYLDRDFYTTFLGQPVIFKSRLFAFLKERWRVYRYFASVGNRGRNSAAAAAANPVARDVSLSRPEPDCSTDPIDSPVVLPTDAYLELLFAKAQFCYLKRTLVYESFQQHIFSSLLSMRELLEARGTGFLVAAYPDQFQVDSALRGRLIERYQLQPQDYLWNRAQTLLRDFSRGHAIEFYDFLDRYRSVHEAGTPLYLANDGHWNAAGNELASEILFEILLPRVRSALENTQR